MDYKVLAIIGIFLFLIFVLLKKFKNDSKHIQNRSFSDSEYPDDDGSSFFEESSSDDTIGFPYQKIGPLFTPAERSFYGVLCQATKDKALVFGKVRIADVLKTEKGLLARTRQIAFNRISGKHFDFVLCKPDDLSILATIELDDSSHNTSKVAKRDQFVESACKAANLKLIRFKVKNSYNVIDVQKTIFSNLTLNNTIESNVSEEDNKAVTKLSVEEETKKSLETKICPKCLSDLIVRTVKKGEKKGNTFYACSSYPRCKYTIY